MGRKKADHLKTEKKDKSPDSSQYLDKNTGRFKPGNPGRKPGAKTKFTKDVKQALFDVFKDLQEEERTSLKKIAKSNPKWFYEIFMKTCVPKNIDITGLMGMMNMGNSELDERIQALESELIDARVIDAQVIDTRAEQVHADTPLLAWDIDALKGNGGSGP